MTVDVLNRRLYASRNDINWVEWRKKLARALAKKKHMNRFVMNYLVTEGYAEAAQKFRLESGTEPQISIATMTNRAAIRKAILDGNVEDAIQKVKNWYPELLVKNPQLYFHLQQQKLIELIRNGEVKEALDFATAELAPKAEKDERLLEGLERTLTLLAYEDATSCPVSKLLDMSQRVKIACEVNAAILVTQFHVKDPRLLGILKELILLQMWLRKRGTHLDISDIATVGFVLSNYLAEGGDLMSLLFSN